MKKLFITLLLLVSGISFSQEKKKTLDEKINKSLDSISKVHKKKICGYGYTIYRGVKETTITYIENGKKINKVIKTEIIPRSEESYE